MSVEALDQKVDAIIAIETTNGVFETPIVADKNFPIGKVEHNADPRLTEGLRDANGKFSPSRKYPAGILGTMTIPSSMMKVDDIKTEIEIAPLFQMSGFQVVDNAGELELVYNGDGNCATGSMRVLNKGCGSSANGIGTDYRGMHGSITVSAESAGSEFKVSFEGQAAIEGTPETVKTVISSGYSNDAATRATELFVGAVEFDGVSTALQNLSFAMNVELMERKDPTAGKNGIDFIYEADIKPMVSITAPLGTNTATWWPNVLSGNVVPLLKYTGEYWDFEFTDLVISTISRDANGEIRLTQELEPTTIKLIPKAVV